MPDLANPGSAEARAQGCRCPVIDNGHGRGYMGIAGIFVITETCPMHTDMLNKPPNEVESDG